MALIKMRQQWTRTRDLPQAMGSMVLLATLLVLCGFASCRRDDPDDGPIYEPKALYQVVGDLNELDEIPCLDTVPIYDPSVLDAYWFAFEDSVFIEHIAVNPNNPKQWVYSKRYVLKGGQNGSGTEAVYWMDLHTGKRKLIDSTENLLSLSWGGDYVVLELSGYCKLYHVSSGSLQDIEGIHPSISPKGQWLKLYVYKDFSNRREDLFSLPDLSVYHSWQYGGGRSPGRCLWLNESTFLYHKSKAYGDAYELKKYEVLNKEEEVVYASVDEDIGLWPVLWFNSQTVVSKWGVKIDFEAQSQEILFPYCENKYFDEFISMGREREFIGKKVYYRADHEAKVVYYSHHFHLLKPDEGLEQRLKLVFDN